ncbi:hypothetical protein BD779DRAFT_1468999 [Infundibulicybe gibba]|nr:hypothetical protein BD779DRAFT_1468999 [Infundibulicybe gibba]
MAFMPAGTRVTDPSILAGALVECPSSDDNASITSNGEKEDVLDMGSVNGSDDDESTENLVIISTDSVMCKKIQDPALYDIYRRLPPLGPLRMVHAFGGKGDEPAEQPRGPALLGTHTRRVVMANTSINMVGIMLGMLTEWYLYRDHIAGSSNKPYITHKVSIIPLAQEFRRDTTVWGQILKFHNIVAQITEDGLSFHTCPKSSAGPEPTSSPSTPRKPRGDIYVKVSSTLSASASQDGTSSSTPAFYPGSRAFEDDIPIYDGRGRNGPPFNFTAKNFEDIRTFPLYHGGHADILVGALVAVGYTLNMYGERAQLSTNIQFLILLGVPK